MSALNITFPTPLPKNEKDLICMLLAGRLKDLFKGKLICAQLAIDDLLKDVTGVSALGSLAGALAGMQSALTGFQAISGYNNILNGVNQALGQIENVFSLGGLCPSPVHAPKIPDLLPQLNANLFGQANNILSALGKLSNPSMCMGGGPGGFGINWNSMTGDLKNLKAAIGQAKATGLGMTPALNAFTGNLKSQTSRLKSEIARLEKNLSDPLGINDKQNTVKSLQRAKDISDGYTVKDANGIEYANALKGMVAGDIEAVFDRTGLASQPVLYVSKPILDYCGDIIGYEKVAVSGDPSYIGWDTAPGATNTDNPTVNPTATYANFDYLFKEENSTITVYNRTGATVTSISLARGKHYRIGLELANSSIKFYSNSTHTTTWLDGLTYSRSPAYGTDMEIITPDNTTTYVRGEVDWAVLIENPTTPNTLYWKATNNQSGTVDVDPASPTVIPLADRTYDISMAARKSGLHLIHSNDYGVQHEVNITTRTYNSVTTRYNTSNQVIAPVTTQSTLSYSIIDDLETLDSNNATNANNKIIKSVSKYSNTSYLITKRYVSIENGYEFNKLYFYISTDSSEANASYCLLIKFDSPLILLNSSKLPYTDNYSYKLTYLKNEGTALEPNFVPVMSPISSTNETTFKLVESNGKQFIRWNLSSYTEAGTASLPKNEFIYQTDIEIDPSHLKRDFISSDPVETRTYFYFKLDIGSSIKSVISLNENAVVTPTPSPSPVPTSAPTPAPTPSPSPVPTPAPTPVSTPAPTPSPSPVPTPAPTPVSTPSPSPVPTPAPTPAPTPSPSPVPTPVPTPAPTPSPSPVPTPVPTPAPSPAPTPVPTGPTYSIVPTVTSINEGGILTYNVTTTGVANGTMLYISSSGTSNWVTSSGSSAINNNSATFNIAYNIMADNTTEGQKTLIINLRTGSQSGPIVATAPTVIINDTSTTPIGAELKTMNYNTSMGDFATFTESGNFTGWIAGIDASNVQIDSTERSSILNNSTIRNGFNGLGLDTTALLNSVINSFNADIGNLVGGENRTYITEAGQSLQQSLFGPNNGYQVHSGKEYYIGTLRYLSVNYSFSALINQYLSDETIETESTSAANSVASQYSFNSEQTAQLKAGVISIITAIREILRGVSDNVNLYDYYVKTI